MPFSKYFIVSNSSDFFHQSLEIRYFTIVLYKVHSINNRYVEMTMKDKSCLTIRTLALQSFENNRLWYRIWIYKFTRDINFAVSWLIINGWILFVFLLHKCKKLRFNVSKIPPFYWNHLKNMVSHNEVATISVLELKAGHHCLQLFNVTSYPFHVFFSNLQKPCTYFCQWNFEGAKVLMDRRSSKI